MGEAELDINEESLIFKYPDTYYLDITLWYKVDSENGKAKFITDKKTLEIDLPIIGLTEKTREEIKRQREEYDNSVKGRLEKAGIYEIDEYKEDVATLEMNLEEGEKTLEQIANEAV